MADKSQLTFDVAGVDLKSKFQMAGGKSTVRVFPFAGEVRSFQVVSARDWKGVSGCSDVAAYTVGDGEQLTSVSFDDGPHSEWPINSVGTIDIVDASFANRVQPNYPTAALNDRVEGDTTVIVAIDPNGSLAEASIYQSSGSALLDQASLDAAKQTTFKPAHLSTTLGGGPIRSVYLIIYTFHPAE